MQIESLLAVLRPFLLPAVKCWVPLPACVHSLRLGGLGVEPSLAGCSADLVVLWAAGWVLAPALVVSVH